MQVEQFAHNNPLITISPNEMQLSSDHGGQILGYGYTGDHALVKAALQAMFMDTSPSIGKPMHAESAAMQNVGSFIKGPEGHSL